jgi:hypothetical protein
MLLFIVSGYLVSYFSWKKKIKKIVAYLTITPSTNKIGTSSTSVSLMDWLKMNFYRIIFRP